MSTEIFTLPPGRLVAGNLYKANDKDGDGNPIVVSGNHGPTVKEAVYPKHKVIAYVMPPTYVLEDMAAAARAAALK